MLQAEKTICLPRSEANEFRKIMESPGELEEKLMATYLRALKPDVFDGYIYQREPAAPDGFASAHSTYRELDLEDKAAGWKAINERFSGYLKKRDEVRSENNSNAFFLKQMEEFFEGKGMQSQAYQVKLRLYQFRETFEAEVVRL